MKKLKIAAVSTLLCIVAAYMLRIPLTSSVLYLTNKKFKKQINFELVQEDIIGKSTIKKSGELAHCGKYLSFILPPEFKVDPKLNKDAKDMCFITSAKLNASISLSDNTQNWNDRISTPEKILNGFEKIKTTPFIEKTLKDINAQSNIFKQFAAILASAKKDQHVFSYDENAYALAVAMAFRPMYRNTPKTFSYQEIDGYTLLKNFNYPGLRSIDILIFTPDNKVFNVIFYDLPDDKASSYLKSLLHADSIKFNNSSYAQDQDREVEKGMKDLEKKGIKLHDLKY